jgi:4-amino-4-deoxy-L-arabinose transferase-like glycosyltransferase
MMTRKSLILIFFVLLKFVLQYLLISPQYDLHRDEYLHLDQGNHLAWGFVSVPPVTACIAAVIKMLGNTPFWIRFFPALFGCLTIVIVWKTVEELKGSLYALILAATCVLFSVLLRLNTLFQPNSLDVLCWTALFFTLIKYINTEKSQWLYFSALVVALGFLNKYNIIFQVVALLPAILLTPQRKMFLHKQLYLAALLAFVLILPNLIWQYQNHFPVIHHLNELAERQLVHVDRLQFFKSQLLFFLGAIFVILAGLYALIVYKPFEKYRFLFWSFIITLLVFVYFKAKDYYTIGLYPVYMAFGASYLEKVLSNAWQKYARVILVAFPVVIFVLMFNVAFPNKSPANVLANADKYKKLGLLRWEDGKDHQLPQDFADMLGWKELASKIDSIYGKLENKQRTIILCDNYGQAGAINYYSKHRNINAVTFNADYINWFKLDSPVYNFIRVKEAEGSADEMEKTKPFFEVGYAADSVTNAMAREYGTTIFVFSKPKVDVNARLRSEVEKERNYR